MTTERSPILRMLKLALATSLNQLQFYQKAAETAQTAEVKALLNVLAESEDAMIDRMEQMLSISRNPLLIVDEITESLEDLESLENPNETPFDLHRNETDPRIFICNKALEMTLKGYSFFLAVSVRAKSNLVSRLFQFFARQKAEQIKKIRRVCETF
jgi:rubrerythrin